MSLLLVLELQEAWFDLGLGVLQRGGGQGRVGVQVGHGGWQLGDATSQLLPGQQGGRGAVGPRRRQRTHVHGGVVGHGDGSGRLHGHAVAAVFGFVVVGLRFDLQRGSEVEADWARDSGETCVSWNDGGVVNEQLREYKINDPENDGCRG